MVSDDSGTFKKSLEVVMEGFATFGNRCLKGYETMGNCSGTSRNVSGSFGRFLGAYGSIRRVMELSKTHKPKLDQVGRFTKS